MKTIYLISQNPDATDVIAPCIAGYALKNLTKIQAPSELQPAAFLLLDTELASAADSWLAYSQFHNIPCFLVSLTPHKNAQEHLGSNNFTDTLTAPFSPAVIHAKVATYLHLFQYARPEHPTKEDSAVICLTSITKARDFMTGNHTLRSQYYVKALAEHLRHHPHYASELDSDETINIYYKTAALHDIGKIGIPDRILQKPNKLTPAEFHIMQQHTVLGHNTIQSIRPLLDDTRADYTARFLKAAEEVTLYHHEHWDGSGYPEGRKGTDIPLIARLLAVADVYDAMITTRSYKPAQEYQAANRLIRKGRGTLFDPAVVDAFTDLEDTFARIAQFLEASHPAVQAQPSDLHLLEEVL